MSESRAQRQKALEERRRRIAELRESRSRRQADTARVQASATANLDDYVTGLLKEPAPGVQQDEASASASAKTENAATTPQKRETAQETAATPAPPVPAPAPARPKLETFEISTQTDPDEFPQEEVEEEVDDGAVKEKEEAESEQGAKGDVEEKDPKLLSSEQIEKEVSSTPFSSFLNTASKKVERMLGTHILDELLVDNVGELVASSSEDIQQQTDASKFISGRQQVYECPKWTSGRDVTDIDWSHLHRDLVLSTYYQRGQSEKTSQSTAVSAISPHDTRSDSLTPRSGELQSDGLALVWSLAMPNRPEHIFTCGSSVTAGRFHPSEASLVVGGCESGQVVVWDVRAGRLPVQKSKLVVGSAKSSKGHTHPIGTMSVLPDGAGFVTSSTDGKVNFWSLANLREPAEAIQIGESVSCLAIAPESGSLLLGDDNGSMFTVPAISGGGQRRAQRQVRKLEAVDGDGENLGHYGMITSVSTKKQKKGVTVGQTSKAGFLRSSGGLVLSSGVDWTVKLWAPAYRDSPLTSLVSHSYDYMSDVQWSPVHPSLFATGSSNGSLGLWNLATSLDEPLTGGAGIMVCGDDGESGINKLSWSLDGRRLAVASSDRLHVLNLTEEVLRSKHAEEDGKRMMSQLMARGWIADRQ